MEARRIESCEISDSRTSLLRYSPALVLVVIAIADIQRWADPDLWGHVAFGRAMLATRHLAFHDPYSYSAPGHLWLNHEWLSELLMGAVYNAFGVIGLKLMKFACTSAVILFLTAGLAETDSPMTAQSAILIAASIAIAPQLQFRPQMFTFVLTSGLVAILARYAYRGSAAVWLAIPMLGLWANLHGGFIVGLAALGTFGAIVLIQDLFRGRGPRRGVLLVAIFGASTMVTLATPYGFDTWAAVAHAMTNPHTREVIDDWQPLLQALSSMWNRNHVGAIPMLVTIAMFVSLVVTVAIKPRSDDLPMVAIAAVMIAAAFLAMRNLPLAVIATVIPLARGSSRAVSARSIAKQTHLWPHQIVVGAAAVALLIATGLLSPTLRMGSPKPNGAIAFMQAHRLRGNTITDFEWGEYVIWHTAQVSKVFIDGRYDTVYPIDVIDDYLAFQSGDAGTTEVLRKYSHDFVLLSSNDGPALRLMATATEWKQLYRDATCILFTREDSEAAQISSVDVPPEQTPSSYFP